MRDHFTLAFERVELNAIELDFEKTQCTKLLMNLTNYFLTYNKTIEIIYRNSGKDYNDLGRYDDCLLINGFHYILASIPKALPIPMAVGMCIPDIC